MRIKPAGMACAITLLLCCAVFGQRNDSNDDISARSVQGIVTDASGHPVAKAVVQLKDTKTLQIRSFITDSDGSYHFAGLSPDVEYELKAEYNGASSPKKTLGVFNTQKTAIINLKLNK
jgi:hypothetical protein